MNPADRIGPKLLATCPQHGRLHFEYDAPCSWWACPFCMGGDRMLVTRYSVIFEEDVATNQDGGEVVNYYDLLHLDGPNSGPSVPD